MVGTGRWENVTIAMWKHELELMVMSPQACKMWPTGEMAAMYTGYGAPAPIVGGAVVVKAIFGLLVHVIHWQSSAILLLDDDWLVMLKDSGYQ